jgi:hypothetical protein
MCFANYSFDKPMKMKSKKMFRLLNACMIKKGDVAGDISTRMPIELCNPQARSNSLLFWQKSLFGKNIMNVLCFYSLITLQNRKKGMLRGIKRFGIHISVHGNRWRKNNKRFGLSLKVCGPRPQGGHNSVFEMVEEYRRIQDKEKTSALL